MKLKYIILFSLIWLYSGAKAQSSLSQYLTIAAENNPQLKAGFQNYMAALQRVPQVQALPDPKLAFGYFIQAVETKTGPQQFKVGLSQMFPWFGTLQLAGQTQAYKAKAAYEDFLEAKANLFKQVKTVYYTLYFQRENIKIIKESIEIVKRFKSLAQQKVITGKSSSVDVLRADMALNQMQNDLKLWQDKFEATKITFENILNKPLNNINLPSELLPEKLPSLAVLQKKLEKNHAILKQDWLSKQFQTKEKLARKKRWPNFSVGVDYTNIGGIQFQGWTNDALLLKVGFSLPIFRSKYKAAEAEANHQQKASSQKKLAIKNTVLSSLENLYAAHKDALRKVNLFERQGKLAKRSIDLLQSDYMSGLPVFEEVLRMEQKYLKYSIEKQKALTETYKLSAAVQYLLGNINN